MTRRTATTFQRYAEGYRLAAARLASCAAASPGGEVTLAGRLVGAWRHHLQLCLEHLLDAAGGDGRRAAPQRPRSHEGAWVAARRVLARDGTMDLAAFDRGLEALARAEASLAGGTALPGGLATLHGLLAPVSEALGRVACRLERRREHERELLTWMV